MMMRWFWLKISIFWKAIMQQSWYMILMSKTHRNGLRDINICFLSTMTHTIYRPMSSHLYIIQQYTVWHTNGRNCFYITACFAQRFSLKNVKILAGQTVLTSLERLWSSAAYTRLQSGVNCVYILNETDNMPSTLRNIILIIHDASTAAIRRYDRIRKADTQTRAN